MSKEFKLDFSKFKHVKSDKDSTTLRHYEGHEIKLAHKKLSKANRDALHAMSAKDKQEVDVPEVKMAEGGLIDRALKYLDDTADKVSGNKYELRHKTIQQKPAPKHNSTENDANNRAKGAYAEGGEVTDDPFSFDPSKLEETILSPEAKLEGAMRATADALPAGADQRAIKMLAIDTLQNKQTQDELKDLKASELAAHNAQIAKESELTDRSMLNSVGVEQPQTEQQPGLMPSQAEMAMPQEQQQSQGLAAQQPQAAVPSMDPSEGILQGYNTQIAGINQQAQAEGALGQEQALIHAKQAADQQQIIDTFDKKQAQLNEDLAQHEQDIKDGYIDPNKYWSGYTAPNGDKVPGHSKVAAAIGMIIAGFNPSGKPNAAIEMLNNEINRSLEGQKQNLQSSNNLLRANLDHFKNVNDATLMTKAMLNDAAITQLQQAADKAKTPLAKAAALQAIGPLQQARAQAMMRVNMNQTMMSLTEGGEPSDTSKAEKFLGMARTYAPELAKDLEPRVIPGVGVATVPVPAETRQKLIEHQQIAKDASYLKEFVKKHGGVQGYNPYDPETIKAKQMALALQSHIRESKLGTVYKEGEQPLLDKFVNENPLTILGKVESIPALEEIIRSNAATDNITRKSVGMKPNIEAPPPPVKGRDGKMYQLNPKDNKYYVVKTAQKSK